MSQQSGWNCRENETYHKVSELPITSIRVTWNKLKNKRDIAHSNVSLKLVEKLTIEFMLVTVELFCCSIYGSQ